MDPGAWWATVHRVKRVGAVQYSSDAKSCPILCDPMNCSMPSFPVHNQPPELIKTHVHWVSDAIQPSHPLPYSSPSALNLSQQRGLFQWVILYIRCFNFSFSPSNEYSGLISFRIDWYDLLAVQGTLKSLLQPHNSKASILWRSAFFIV